MRLSAYDTLEVVYLFRPFGVPLGDRTLRGLTVVCREGTLDELQNLQTNTNKLVLYVLTPQDYVAQRKTIQRFMEKSGIPTATIGFLLIESPDHLATVRLRKKVQQAIMSPWIMGDVRAPYTFNQIFNETNKASHHLFLSANQDLFRSMVAIREIEAQSINEVGLAMMSQSSLDEFMRLILEKAIELSTADAGFLLLRENLLAEPYQDDNNVKLLRRTGTKFVLKNRLCKSQNIRLHPNMLDPQLSEFISVVVNRACGLSWSFGQEKPTFRATDEFQFPDINLPPPELEFDKKAYAVKSYCIFPLRTPAQEVVGFIFLLNRRISSEVFCDSIQDINLHVTEFSSHDLNILEALSNQAGVSIDHTRLYKDLKTVFESFVTASVTAIESRDPTTKGHSERVAIMTVGLAEAVNRVSDGPYGNISFNPSQLYELKYAALLHDFGKIGVQEDVLRKEKKLFPNELAEIRERFSVIESRLHVVVLESYIEKLLRNGTAPQADELAAIRRELSKITENFSQFWELVSEANEPHVVHQDSFQKIAELAALRILVGDKQMELLKENDIKRLSIRKGSLSPDERLEIESHVTHSYRFLIQIPWTSDLANIPDIVYGHHERMDGSGYPRRLKEDEIPIQARIMAIADIYDALVAMDRPYKKAIPKERALSILEAEVREGKLDPYIFQIFVQAHIGDLVHYPELEVA